jgi:uncharacterized protein with GYD domain
MPFYVLMTTLNPGSIKDAADRKGKGKKWLDKMHEACPEVKWLAHYALLGRYDFMDIYEAPDESSAHKVSLISRQAGAVTAESWPAITYDQHLNLMAEVGQ